MIDHRRALMLAATAVDFPLDASDRGILDAHVRACAACRMEVTAFSHDAARLAALPPTAPPEWVRGAIGRSRRPNRLVLLAAAALLLSAAVGAALVGAGLRTDRTPDVPPSVRTVPSPAATSRPLASPTTAPTASSTATPRSSAPAAVRGVDWEWRDVWFENPLGLSPSLDGVTFVGTGFIAWGANVGGSATETSSGDLGSWQGGDAGLFRGVRIIGMAYAPAGIVALGVDAAGVVHAWRSADGTTWKAGPARSGIDGAVNTIVNSSGGTYFAAGTAKGGCDVAIWSSFDGLTWQPSGPLNGARGTCSTGGVTDSPQITLVRDGAAGLVAYGTVPGIGSAFWTSADRVHWTFRPQPSLGGHVAGLAATSSGYIAVGTVGTGGGIVWRSPDGATWTRVPDQAALADAVLADVVALDDGSLVAVGSDAEHAFVAWTSTDGQAWVRGPAPVSSDGSSPGRPDNQVSWKLASDGHASTNPSELLIAVGGGSRAMVSPPVTPGLRAGSVTITLSGPVDLASETVAGSCANSQDGSGGTDVHVVLADLAQPNPADVNLTVGRDGRITGFSLTSDSLGVSLGNGSPIDPSLLATATGSTSTAGEATFHDLVSSLAPAASVRLAGSVAWQCSG